MKREKKKCKIKYNIEADCIFCGIDSAYGWICSSGILGTWNHWKPGCGVDIAYVFARGNRQNGGVLDSGRMAEAIPAEMPEPENTSIKFTFWIGVSLACIVLADAFNSLRKWIMESQSEA